MEMAAVVKAGEGVGNGEAFEALIGALNALEELRAFEGVAGGLGDDFTEADFAQRKGTAAPGDAQEQRTHVGVEQHDGNDHEDPDAGLGQLAGILPGQTMPRDVVDHDFLAGFHGMQDLGVLLQVDDEVGDGFVFVGGLDATLPFPAPDLHDGTAVGFDDAGDLLHEHEEHIVRPAPR